MRINEQIPKPTERDAVAKKRKTPILLAIVSGLVTWASLIVILLVTTGNINQTSPIAGTEREKARVETAAPGEAFEEDAAAMADAAEGGIADAVSGASAPAGGEQIPASFTEAADAVTTDAGSGLRERASTAGTYTKRNSEYFITKLKTILLVVFFGF